MRSSARPCKRTSPRPLPLGRLGHSMASDWFRGSTKAFDHGIMDSQPDEVGLFHSESQGFRCPKGFEQLQNSRSKLLEHPFDPLFSRLFKQNACKMNEDDVPKSCVCSRGPSPSERTCGGRPPTLVRLVGDEKIDGFRASKRLKKRLQKGLKSFKIGLKSA